jgi:transposase
MTQTIKRYSEAFRRQVVSEYEAGSAIPELQKKYGITGSETIQNWIKKYASEGLRHAVVRIQTAEEANRVKQLESQIEQLERALARTTLEKLKLESILEELQVKEEVKKNAVLSSPGSTTKSNPSRSLT